MYWWFESTVLSQSHVTGTLLHLRFADFMERHDGGRERPTNLFERNTTTMMKIWIDRDGKVHSKSSGDIRKQMSEVDAIVNYLQNYALNCKSVSNKIMCFDASLCTENEELRRQLKVACNTIDAADKAMREKSQKCK